LNPKHAGEIVDQLQADFGDFIPRDDETIKRNTIRRLVSLDVEDEVASAGARELFRTWTGRRAPTLRDVVAAIEAEAQRRASRRGSSVEAAGQRASNFKLSIGVEFLALFAEPAATVCELCRAEYVPRGVMPDDRLLRHRHFTIREVDQDGALELAIAQAKAAMRSPLEAKARPIDPDQEAARREGLRLLRMRTLAHLYRPPEPQPAVPAHVPEPEESYA
jgi:hypothetical protein